MLPFSIQVEPGLGLQSASSDILCHNHSCPSYRHSAGTPGTNLIKHSIVHSNVFIKNLYYVSALLLSTLSIARINLMETLKEDLFPLSLPPRNAKPHRLGTALALATMAYGGRATTASWHHICPPRLWLQTGACLHQDINLTLFIFTQMTSAGKKH